MSRSNVTVAIDIAASPASLWAYLERVEDHVEWMADAESITFHSDQRRGVGTAFTCLTKVGPIRLNDEMTITEWETERTMGVRHQGLVTGQGRFTLEPKGNGTLFTWTERLTFPWFLGGPVVAAVAGRFVLGPIWRRNLKRLRSIVDGR